MNIYFCNINRINEEVEEFVIAKNKIEQPLIDNEELEKKMSIQEFLDYIDLTKHVFVSNDEHNISIPFAIYNPSKNVKVIIYSLEENVEKYTQIFKDNLEKINYDINKLTKITQLEILQGIIQDKSYYIINDEFYM